MNAWLVRMRRFAALWLVAGSAVAVPASIPALAGRVTDGTGTLTGEQVAALDQRLAAFEARKGVQFAVLMVKSTRPEAIEQYALRAAEQWKLGRVKVDDGALVVIAKDDRTLRIEVGYGLEGVLNDLATSRIITEVMVPRLAQGDFAGGITAGINRMIAVVDGEPLPSPARAVSAAEELPPFVPVLVILALVSSALLRAWIGKAAAALVTAGLVGAAAWFLAGAVVTSVVAAALAGLFTLAGGRSVLAALGGGHGRGGWGRGGGGGGGFRGGGGGFGGGGSSGRW